MDTRKGCFSTWLYILVVFGLSWPFQVIAAIWGHDLLPRFLLHSSSMSMVTVGTFICGRFIFRDGFAEAGWSWGKAKYHLAVIGLALVLWAAPTIIDLAAGTIGWPSNLTRAQIVWVPVFFTVGLIPCFGEEFGWRGYMLPRLARRHSPRKAVIIHAIIWWAWHLPGLVGVGIQVGIASAKEMGFSPAASAAVMIFAMALFGAVPAALHGVIFAYIWVRSRSIAVATVYHEAYDGVRDSIGTTIGLGPVAGLWSVAVIVILGIILLWKGNWSNLEAHVPATQNTD